jgi:hypothetical protein
MPGRDSGLVEATRSTGDDMVVPGAGEGAKKEEGMFVEQILL